ncbi:MAG: aldose 1-epimerase family protein [Thermoguttaceae bacterium]|nr:aldose 1-epimerase family protein [Thermoguttaceae bacterium]
MSQKTRTIIDTVGGIYTETMDIEGVFAGPRGTIPYRVTKRRLHGGKRDGIDLIEVNNGCLTLYIIPTRGMSLWRGRCGDVEMKWNTPLDGPVHPALVPIFDPSGLGFLEGFDEWFVRCGLESNGAPEFTESGVLKYPLHGRIANLPAKNVQVTVDDETGVISVTGIVEEARLFGRRLTLTVTYTTCVGTSQFTVHDSVTNQASTPDQFQLLYHINTGMPFTGPGAKAVIPYEEMAPRNEDAVAQYENWNVYKAPEAGKPESCFYFDLAAEADGNTRVMLVNTSGDRGIAFGFNKKQIPHFVLWKLEHPDGDTYVSGMEPCMNFPNTHSYEVAHHRVIPLAPGETRAWDIHVEILRTPEEIEKVDRYIQQLQSNARGKVWANPKPGWSSEGDAYSD